MTDTTTTPELTEPTLALDPETDDPTPEERETAFALLALCRTIDEAKAAIAARERSASQDVLDEVAS